MATAGCRKTAYITGISCLGCTILIAIFVAGSIWLVRRAARNPSPTQAETTTITIPSGPSGAEGAAGEPATPPAASPGEGAGSLPPEPPPTAGRDLPDAILANARPTRLTLYLDEGDFDVLPGPPGSELKVDGYFDRRDYELTQDTVEQGDMGREVTIRFRPKRSWFFRLLSGRLDTRNKVTVTIPEGIPTALKLNVGKGQSRVELGGLALTDLEGNLSMGDHRVSFNRPLPRRLPRVVLRSSMGETRVSGLGNAAPESFSMTGSMGQLTVDFRGQWPAGAQSKGRIHLTMGQVDVRVPENMRISPTSSTRVSLGEARTRGLREGETEDPNAPTLELDLSASMGEASIRRD